jgi:hypothetical protein
VPHGRAVWVRTDYARAADVGLQTAEHVADVGRAAQAGFALVSPQQDDGGLLADAFGVAPGVAVEDQIAHHQHARAAQTVEQREQVCVHRP